ncbi:carbohydrate esterase family 3 protein, partial [Sphaerulina musiva SO2202]
MTQLPIRTPEERSIARSTKRSLHGQQDSPKQHRRILIIGDSITHGGEGDYTWRYRLWQWFSVSFVGPYTGVNPRPSLVAPHPVPLPDDQSPDDPYCPPNRIPWGYARDVDASFATGCRHFATWGYQAHQCMQSIAKVVEDWSPDLIISLLGFNDIGWCVSDAEGTLQAIQGIVRFARIAKERVQNFVIGNIVNRTLLDGREDLIENTRKFNSLLLDRAHSWDQHNSKVVVADVAALYDCGPQYRDWAPAAYDGLHPSALGEFQIAKAFTETLHQEFGWGSKGLEIPSSSHHGDGGGVPKRNLQVPEGITAKSTPMGIQVLWKDVFGAAYQVHWREFSSYSLSSSFSSSSSSRGKPELVNNNNDWTLSESSHPQIFLPVPQHCTIEFQLRCHHGFETGPWSPIYKAKCVDAPIPAPTNIQTFPNSIGFEVRWDAP